MLLLNCWNVWAKFKRCLLSTECIFSCIGTNLLCLLYMRQNLMRSTYNGRLICSVQRGSLSIKICLGPGWVTGGVLQKMQLHYTSTGRSESVGSTCKHVSRAAD